jgi:integrase
VYIIKYLGLLRNYLEINKIENPEQLLFPSPKNPGKPIHPVNINKHLYRISKQLNIKLHPHLLRHLRATQLIKEKNPGKNHYETTRT